LQHRVPGRSGGDHLDGAAALEGHELVLVIVIAGPQAERAQRVGGLGERAGDLAPAVQSLDSPGAGHHDILAAQRLVELDGFGEELSGQIAGVVVGGVAADAQVVQQLAVFLGGISAAEITIAKNPSVSLSKSPFPTTVQANRHLPEPVPAAIAERPQPE
jgi:hypothetical protein